MDADRLPEELPRVTAAHLRRADSLCPLRVSKEMAGKRGARAPQRGYELANRIDADARQAHCEMRVATSADFPLPRDLTVEECRVYRSAAAWYLALFASAAARAADVDVWSTTDEETGTQLVGQVGLAVDCADGTSQVRVLSVARDPRPHDDVTRAFALLRLSAWIGDRTLELVWVDLMSGRIESQMIDARTDLPPARELMARRLETLAARVIDARPRPGQDCAGCRYIAECAAHK